LRLRLAKWSASDGSDLENADKKLVELRQEIDRCAAFIPQMIAQLKQPAGSA